MIKTVYQLDMCLWKTYAPSDNKVKIWQKSLSATFWPGPTHGACDVSEMWGTQRLTYSPCLVTVSSPNFKYCTLFARGTELRTNKHTDWRTKRITDDPITRCPRRAFQALAIEYVKTFVRVGYVPQVWTRAQVKGLKELRLTIGWEDSNFLQTKKYTDMKKILNLHRTNDHL